MYKTVMCSVKHLLDAKVTKSAKFYGDSLYISIEETSKPIFLTTWQPGGL